MTVQTIPYLDFATIVEAITDVSDAAYMLRATGQNRVEHALAVPNAGIGDMEYYPSMPEKAATLAYQIIQGHPLIDGNKRTGYVCMLELLYRNGYTWRRPAGDGETREETVTIIEGIASGNISLTEFTNWVQHHVVVESNSTSSL